MNNFRKPKKQPTKTDSLDGFVPNSGNIDIDNDTDIRKRFSSSYSPKKSNQQSIQRISKSDEGYRPRLNDLENTETVDFDFQLDDDSGKSKKKSRSLRKRFARVVAVSFLAMIIAVGSLFAYGYLKTRQIFRGNGDGAVALQENVDPEQLNGEGEVFVLGDNRVNSTDSRVFGAITTDNMVGHATLRFIPVNAMKRL